MNKNIIGISEKSFLIQKKSLLVFSWRFLVFFYPLNLYQYKVKGKNYYYKNIVKILLLTNLPILLFVVFEVSLYLLKSDLLTPPLEERPHFLVFRLVTISYGFAHLLGVFFNLTHDEKGSKIIYFSKLLRSKEELEKYNNAKESFEKNEKKIKAEKLKAKKEKEDALNEKLDEWSNKYNNLENRLKVFKGKFPLNSRKPFLINEPLFDRPSIKTAQIYVSNNHLVFTSDDIQKELDQLWSQRHHKIIFNIFKNIEELEEYEFPHFAIPLENIISYSVSGTRQQINKISGGGSSLSGALIGGLVAGDVGAIIGSRKPIKSELKEVDNREVRIVYSLGKSQEIKILRGTALIALDKLIPDKFEK